MSKRWTIAWLTIVFSLLIILSIYTFRKGNPLFLVGAEVLIPLSYGFTIYVFLRSLKPISSIGRSMNLLKEGDFSVTLVKTGNREVDDIIDVYNSMIGRLREERLSVREKNHFLDLLIDSSPLGIIIVDFDEKVIDINKSALKYLGIERDTLSGKGLNEFKNSMITEVFRISYDEKQLIVNEGKKYLCRKSFFMDHGFRHPFYIIEEFTEEIHRAEKEAYGKLIRMMAHEVNNTIGSVNSIMSTLRSNPESFIPGDREEIVRILSVAIQRNYQLNRFMQNLSNVVKIPQPEKELISLAESVEAVLESYSAILKEKGIRLSTDLNHINLYVSADRSQMEQVFSNIIKNSIEAVKSNGNLYVYSESNPLRLCFEDDGSGLNDAASEKIFTPFFSTKHGIHYNSTSNHNKQCYFLFLN